MGNINFNAANVSPFSPLPEGEYIAQVVDSDVKNNRAGTGQYISLQFEILDGEFKGRRVFNNLNISHTNKTAEQIGQSQLSALCHAVNVIQLNNTSQLHGIPLKINLRITTSDRYGDQNEVTGYKPANGQALAGNAAQEAAPSGATATPSQASPPPWQR